MQSPFESVIKGEKPWLVLAEDAHFIAMMEEKPLVLGHCLVFPKRMEDSFMDLTPDELSRILVFAQPISRAIQKVVPCQKIGLAVIGLQARHAHLHLVPINSADDLNFTHAKLEVPEEELLRIAQLIRASV